MKIETYEKKRNETKVTQDNELRDFVHYVHDFYQEMDCGFKPTRMEIILAIGQIIFVENKVITGDSVDRERVREILQPEYSAIWGLKPWTK